MADLRFPGRSEMIGTLSASQKVNVGDLLYQIQAAVFRGRIRLREFFTDFDPLGSGKVTEAKFRTALDESGLKLSDPQMTELAKAFADPTDSKRVKYEDLLHSLEVFVTPNMELDPASTVSDFTPSLARIPTSMTPAEEAELGKLLAMLSHRVKTRGLLVRPFFADYEKNVNSTLVIDHVTQ